MSAEELGEVTLGCQEGGGRAVRRHPARLWVGVHLKKRSCRLVWFGRQEKRLCMSGGEIHT